MYELRVLNGLHRGAALPLIGEHWLIGSSEQHDLLLQDPGIARRHCRLTRDGERWRLEAEDGSLIDSEGDDCISLLELGPEQRFQLAGVNLSIMASCTPWPAAMQGPTAAINASTTIQASENRPALHKRLLIAAIVVTVASSAWAFSTPVRLSPPSMSRPAIQAHATPNLNDMVDTLRSMLRDRELHNAISVNTAQDGISLRGSLMPEQMELYQRMLERFKHQQRRAFVLNDYVKPFTRKLPFEIVQITGGERAHLLLADNRRLFLGDEVDGLRLTKIDNEHVEFDGDEHYEVRW